MILPQSFLDRVAGQLGDEMDAFLASYDRPYAQGVRANTLKISAAELAKRHQLTEPEPVDWCRDAFYMPGALSDWSKHPDYFAGLYYLQEPSAMSPAATVPIEPGDRVLDMCAAPGGKSTQLLARLGGTGLLVSNDISASRAKALLKNLEMFGATNAVVTSAETFRLAENFAGFFDKVLVDAPCSGEGMFNKEPSIVKNWEQYGPPYYSAIQHEILPHAVKMLKPGGMLLYSTCTFAPLEDEEAVEWLTNTFPEMSVISERRFWPHQIKGQGHFVALLQKDGSKNGDSESLPADISRRGGLAPKPFTEWAGANLTDAGQKKLFEENDFVLAKSGMLYKAAVPDGMLRGIRVLRNGRLLGDVTNGRLEPSEALAMTLQPADVVNVLNLPLTDERITRYLKGETIFGLEPEKEKGFTGWGLCACAGFALGWIKGSLPNAEALPMYKNKYLKFWRI